MLPLLIMLISVPRRSPSRIELHAQEAIELIQNLFESGRIEKVVLLVPVGDLAMRAAEITRVVRLDIEVDGYERDTFRPE